MCLNDGGRTIQQIQSVRGARSFAGRNQAIKTFLDTDCDWLFWIDSDMAFSPSAYDILLREAIKGKAKIISALAYIWLGNAVIPNIFYMRDSQNRGSPDFEIEWRYEKDSRFWCDATGVAFTLIHREVFEKLREGRWHEDHIEHPEVGHPMGHDLAFFYQANKLGYRVWYCADAKTRHIKSIGVDEPMFETFLQMKGAELGQVRITDKGVTLDASKEQLE
jgi:GT2 family glycosyltransferase